MIKTRIAPSPTGSLHLGTVRTALYNMLFAKHHNGHFYFRLEDTDVERSKEEFTLEIINGFKWIGVEWDSPDPDKITGVSEQGIVRQSARINIHQKYIDKLLAESKAYKCFATKEELDELREKQKKTKQAESYDNRGRFLTKEQIAGYEAEGRSYVVRLNLGEQRDIKWDDLIRGPMSINTKDLGGDPVIQKATGQLLYNFAVVIDDHEMGITHVFRGEDHLTNTAKQIAIFEALGWPLPQFGHLPLIFTTNREKLSKRKHGDIAGIAKYQTEGYLPESLANYLIATSYTSSKGTSELYTINEAVKAFDISRISKSPAIYDIQKLNWYNREYIKKLDHDSLMIQLRKFLRYDLSELSESHRKTLIEAVKDNLNKFDEINDNVGYFFEESAISTDLQSYIDEGEVILEQLLNALDNFDFNNPDSMKESINQIGHSLSVKGKNLFWPIRIAVSAKTHGPDLGLIFMLLGKDNVKSRIQKSLKTTCH